jgi:hypothetical protein
MYNNNGEILDDVWGVDPHTLSDNDLITLHDRYMEDPTRVYEWRALDDELNYRCEEQGLEWPY